MSLIRSFIDFLYPPECLGCMAPTTKANQVCSECFSKCCFLHEPLCECCGYPLEKDQAMDDFTKFSPPEKNDSVSPDYAPTLHKIVRCGPCILNPPPYTLRSALAYDDFSKDLILKLKYFDRLDLSGFLARFLFQIALPYIPFIDYLIPVPLHRKRLWKRRYNQATELSHALNHHIKTLKNKDIPVVTNTLIRIKATESQGFKSYQQRLRNVRGAFIVRQSSTFEPFLKGKSIALIDDVYTSGSTTQACVKALLKEGVKDIYVFTLARVIKGQRLI